MGTKKVTLPSLFIGVDMHKRSWKIHTATDLFDGKSFSMQPDSIRAVINSKPKV